LLAGEDRHVDVVPVMDSHVLAAEDAMKDSSASRRRVLIAVITPVYDVDRGE
jgi:hypothetical protein